MKKKYIILISVIVLSLIITFLILLACDVFKPNYTVTFNLNMPLQKGAPSLSLNRVFDTKIENYDAERTVKSGNVIGHQEPPHCAGYMFAGWKTADGKKWSLYEDKVYCDMVLYAIWEEVN